MRVSPEWTEYKSKYPVRANWMLKELERIKRHPICVAQFPEAVCDYVTAAILHTARQRFKYLKATCGTVAGRNHVWLHDTDADVYLDFTSGQFNSVGLDIAAGPKESMEAAGYIFENEDDCDEVIKSAEEQYLNNLAKTIKKGGKRRTKRKTRRYRRHNPDHN